MPENVLTHACMVCEQIHSHIRSSFKKKTSSENPKTLVAKSDKTLVVCHLVPAKNRKTIAVMIFIWVIYAWKCLKTLMLRHILTEHLILQLFLAFFRHFDCSQHNDTSSNLSGDHFFAFNVLIFFLITIILFNYRLVNKRGFY